MHPPPNALCRAALCAVAAKCTWRVYSIWWDRRNSVPRRIQKYSFISVIAQSPVYREAKVSEVCLEFLFFVFGWNIQNCWSHKGKIAYYLTTAAWICNEICDLLRATLSNFWPEKYIFCTKFQLIKYFAIKWTTQAEKSSAGCMYNIQIIHF